MSRRFNRSRWPEAIAVFGIAVLAVVVIVGNWGGRGGPDDRIDAEPPPIRDFTGIVVGDDAPLAGITLELFEGSHGPVGKATSDGEGRFSIRWTPRTLLLARKLVLVGTDPDGRFARTAAPLGERFEMRRPTPVKGVVVGSDGKPWPGAVVAVAAHGQRYGRATSDAEGRIEIAGLPERTALDAFVHGGELAPRAFRDFRVGDFLVLHVQRGKTVELSVHDPAGREVEGAWARASAVEPFTDEAPSVPVKDGIARVVVATHANGLVEVGAPGHIPVFVDAPTYGQADAVLWPSREVALRVWDGWAKRGVLGVETQVTLTEAGDNKGWNGRQAESTWREFPLTYGPNRGAYKIRLPRTPTTLTLQASGYATASAKVPPDVSRVLIRMPPVQKAKTATLKVRSAAFVGEHWMVVADEEDRWYSAFVVKDGEGRVRVPAGRRLELASAGASDGRWLPRMNIKPIPANRTRVVGEPALSPAAELIVKLDPPTEAEITLVDEKFGKAVPALRQVVTGEARFWVRSKRTVKVTIEPKGNFHTYSGEFEVELPRREWTAFLKPSAGFDLRVRDPEGRPIPSATVLVWESLRGGRINLRGQPRRYRTDATGALEVLGLRNGPTPFEIRSPGFRVGRPRPLELAVGKVIDAGTIRMVPARILRGMVTDPDGKPLAGVRLRTAGRGLRRLELPGGGARDLYDVTGGEEWDAMSDAQGRFDVRDATHRLPLLVCQHPDFAITVAEVGNLPMTVAMHRKAELAVVLPSGSPVDGVYVLLSSTRAIRVHALGGLSMNPLPLTLPVGRTELFVRLRNQRWAAPILDLAPGDQRVSIDRFQPPR